MGSFKLGKMTMRSLFGKPETVQYPFETKPQPEGLKGSVQVDMVTCIGCGICARVCPAGSIEVDKTAGLWSIDRFDCVQCGSCIRACPKDSLIMDPNYHKPTRTMARDTFFKPEESEEELAAKEAAKKAKLEAALAAKAAREAAE